MDFGINKNLVSASEFEKNSSLKTLYKDYNSYISAQLKSTSIHSFDISKLKYSTNPSDELRKLFNAKLTAFNAKSEELIEKYQALKPEYINAKDEYEHYAKKIDTLGDKAKTSEKSKLLKLKNTANESELNYDVALSIALDHTHSATRFMA